MCVNVSDFSLRPASSLLRCCRAGAAAGSDIPSAMARSVAKAKGTEALPPSSRPAESASSSAGANVSSGLRTAWTSDHVGMVCAFNAPEKSLNGTKPLNRLAVS